LFFISLGMIIFILIILTYLVVFNVKNLLFKTTK
jgi:hypothetical protein